MGGSLRLPRPPASPEVRRLRYCNHGIGVANRWFETISPKGSKTVDLPNGTLVVLHSDAVAAVHGERAHLRKAVEVMQAQGGPLGTSSHEIDQGWLLAVAEVLALLDEPVKGPS